MNFSSVKLFLAIFVIGLGFFIVSVSDVSAQATLSISPGSGSYSTGKTFTASVVASAPQAYNTIGATVSFTPSQLNVVSISKGSFAQLCAVDPTYSNSQGTINFGCGNTTGTTGSATIVTITFKAVGLGSTRVSFSDGQVLAADGKGTNILSNMLPANYTLSASSSPPPSPPPSGNLGRNTLAAPDVESSTHPEQDEWYNSSIAIFSWDLPSGATSLRLILSTDETTIPSTRYSPPIAEKTIEEIEDGVLYFRIRLLNLSGLGDVATFKIQVDTVAPNEFSVEVISEEGKAEPKLKFEAFDELSGIDYYEITVDGGEPVLIDTNDINNNIYKMRALDVGESEIIITAVDKAGNKTSADSVRLDITEEIKKKSAVALSEEGPSFFEKYGNAILIFILLAIIAGLIAVIILQKKKLEELKITATREVGDVRTTLEKVLSALRDEGEDLFAGMDGKIGLNNKEAEAFAKLREAIDISEELVNREIDDVDKLFKR